MFDTLAHFFSTAVLSPARAFKNFLVRHELLSIVFFILVIVLPIRFFIAQPFLVQGDSMVPTFHNNEYLIIDQLTYRFEEPRRGDVIVFRYPNNPSIFYIKRIIGLPGETVNFSKGVVTVKTVAGDLLTLTEPYTMIDDATYNTSRTLKKDQFYVLGDNRPSSSDSRVWGELPREDIIGRAWFRLWPLEKLSSFPGAYTY